MSGSCALLITALWARVWISSRSNTGLKRGGSPQAKCCSFSVLHQSKCRVVMQKTIKNVILNEFHYRGSSYMMDSLLKCRQNNCCWGLLSKCAFPFSACGSCPIGNFVKIGFGFSLHSSEMVLKAKDKLHKRSKGKTKSIDLLALLIKVLQTLMFTVIWLSHSPVTEQQQSLIFCTNTYKDIKAWSRDFFQLHHHESINTSCRMSETLVSKTRL